MNGRCALGRLQDFGGYNLGLAGKPLDRHGDVNLIVLLLKGFDIPGPWIDHRKLYLPHFFLQDIVAP